ncbi:GntP family permease [Tellurirhabdus bombi]|uniref:GntP family permease n=1 Tax=Tellurirhabdus bombi TaxID=2907205 RepID=UPI001F24455D|nr:GntP family permease [Tellurirhabdus bombi]
MSPAFLLAVSIIAIILLSSRYKLHTFIVLFVLSLLVGLSAGLSGDVLLKSIREGFGHTLEKIGLLVVLGTLLGSLLDRSKATLSLANAILHRTGRKRAPLAVILMAFLVGLPIFCDSGFIVLSGLVLTLAYQLIHQGSSSGNIHLRLVLCLAGGLYSVHCLVPPHPGITAAVGILNVDTGRMILLGTALSVPGTVIAYIWAKYAGQRFGPSVHLDALAEQPVLEADHSLPSAKGALAAILVPIGLIALKSIVSLSPAFYPEAVLAVLGFIGDPLVALCVGICIALGLFQKLSKPLVNELTEEAIVKAGPVLVIVGAGGAFGEIIRQLGLERELETVAQNASLGLLVPFLLAALFKTAQGSSTVAVMSAASILQPLLPKLGFATEWEQLLALAAMGAGSMTVSHANDAYFWVVSRFGRIEAPVMFRSYTVLTLLMGLTTFFFICLLHVFT